MLRRKRRDTLAPDEMLTITWAALNRLRRARGVPRGPHMGPWTALDSRRPAARPARFERRHPAVGRDADAWLHFLD